MLRGWVGGREKTSNRVCASQACRVREELTLGADPIIRPNLFSVQSDPSTKSLSFGPICPLEVTFWSNLTPQSHFRSNLPPRSHFRSNQTGRPLEVTFGPFSHFCEVTQVASSGRMVRFVPKGSHSSIHTYRVREGSKWTCSKSLEVTMAGLLSDFTGVKLDQNSTFGPLRPPEVSKWSVLGPQQKVRFATPQKVRLDTRNRTKRSSGPL